MKRKTLYLFAFILLLSCNNQEELPKICNVDKPIENLEWLKEIKTNLEKVTTINKSSIVQYSYKNDTVFLINSCENCADAISTVYNCKGEKICEFGGVAGLNTCADFDATKTNKKVIWQNYNQVIIDKTLFKAVNTQYYQITDAKIDGNFLTITISSGGCSGDSWIVNLVDSGDIAKSNPVQRFAKIQLINQEACLAQITKSFTFDITKLKANYNTLILNINKWNTPLKY